MTDEEYYWERRYIEQADEVYELIHADENEDNSEDDDR